VAAILVNASRSHVAQLDQPQVAVRLHLHGRDRVLDTHNEVGTGRDRVSHTHDTSVQLDQPQVPVCLQPRARREQLKTIQRLLQTNGPSQGLDRHMCADFGLLTPRS